MEDKETKDKKNIEEIEDDFFKCARKALGIEQKPTIPNFPINKKIQKKFLKEKPFPLFIKKIGSQIDNINTEGEQKEITKKITYPSGITKTITKNGKNEIINEEIDYSELKENYINKIKNNIDKELKKIIENAFLLFNRKQIIRNIVKKPLSTKSLEEKILLWKFYIKNLTKEEKALLIRKLIYYIGKFSELVYDEFLKIKEVSNAYLILILKGILKKNEKKTNHSTWMAANKFYTMTSLLGYDADGNPEKEEKSNSKFTDEARAMILLHCVLNIKEELNGTGLGYVFLKELNDIFQMYSNSSIIFESIFYGCYDIFEKDDFILSEKLQTYRLLWSFFADYFIDDPFVIKFITQLKYIFAIYRQDEVVKYMHDLVLVRWNINEIKDRVKEKLVKLIGPEEIFDEKEKVEKMDNIDDVMKYIEGDEKPKKKKKKKKKNQNKINMLDDLLKKKEDKKDTNIIDDIDDIDDGLSIISEADSVLDSFKNDIIAETEYNTGKKVVPTLSSEFLNKFQK